MSGYEQKEREVKERKGYTGSDKNQSSAPATSPLPGGPSSGFDQITTDTRKAIAILKGFITLDDAPLLGRPYSASLSQAVILMHQAGIKDRRDFEALLSQPQHAECLAQGFIELYKAGILEENRRYLLDHPQYADRLARGFIFLHEAEILEENREHLLAQPQYADRIGQGLAGLHSAEASTPRNQIGVLAQPRYAHRVSQGLVSLHKIDAKALAPKDCLALCSVLCLPENAPYADKLGRAWAILVQVGLTMSLQTVRTQVTSPHAKSFIDTLSSLREWELLDKPVLTELQKQVPHLENLLPILQGLSEENLLNRRILTAFLKQASKAKKLVEKLSEVAKERKLSLDDVVILLEQSLPVEPAPALLNAGATMQFFPSQNSTLVQASSNSQTRGIATSNTPARDSSSSAKQDQVTDAKSQPG
jgi:hypothetical protein